MGRLEDFASHAVSAEPDKALVVHWKRFYVGCELLERVGGAQVPLVAEIVVVPPPAPLGDGSGVFRECPSYLFFHKMLACFLLEAHFRNNWANRQTYTSMRFRPRS